MSDPDTKLVDLNRVVTSPAVIQINSSGDRRAALFVRLETSEGDLTFCFNVEEADRLIKQLQDGRDHAAHTEGQLGAVDWESLRPTSDDPPGLRDSNDDPPGLR